MKTLAFFPPTPSSLAVVLLRLYLDSCHLPPSRLTDRWMSATSGAMGLSSTTPVNPNTHALVNPWKRVYCTDMHTTSTRTHTSVFSPTLRRVKTHKDTLSKALPPHFLSPCAVGTLKSVSFSFFPPVHVLFFHRTQMWGCLTIPFHSAFCSPFLLMCVNHGQP